MEDQYLQWCEIMKQKPKYRDEIIFNAGREFYLLSKNTSHNSESAKCLCGADAILHYCPHCWAMEIDSQKQADTQA